MSCQMNNALVSIIVPVYNCESFLNRCVDSILTQSYANFELVLVDDGSKDNSGSICDSYSSDHRVKVIHQVNAGVTAARKNGFLHSSGEYITYVDADDSIESDMVQSMVDCMSENIDIVCFGADSERAITPAEYAKYILSYRLLAVWGKLYRRHLLSEDVFDIPRYFNIGEDFLMQLKLIKNTTKSIFLSSINLYIYNTENPNSVQVNAIKTYEYEKRMMLFTDDIIKKYSKELQDQISESYFRWRMSYLGGMIGLKYPVEFHMDIFKYIIEDSKYYNLSRHDNIVIKATDKSFYKWILIFEKKGRFLVRRMINLIKR